MSPKTKSADPETEASPGESAKSAAKKTSSSTRKSAPARKKPASKTKAPAAKKTSRPKLGQLIIQARRKVGAAKDVDIRRYLPDDQGFQLHHSTFTRWRKEEPQKLYDRIEKYIVAAKQPRTIAPKSRQPAAAPSRKRSGKTAAKAKSTTSQGQKTPVGQTELKHLLGIAKRYLIASIEAEQIDAQLWSDYQRIVHTLRGGG